MKLKNLAIGLLAAVATVGAIESTPVLAKDSIFIPVFSYRSGPFAPGGAKIANGYTDYFKLVQKRDGGVEGGREERRAESRRARCCRVGADGGSAPCGPWI